MRHRLYLRKCSTKAKNRHIDTCKLFTCSMHPPMTSATLNHLRVPVIVSITPTTHRTEITCNNRQYIAVTLLLTSSIFSLSRETGNICETDFVTHFICIPRIDLKLLKSDINQNVLKWCQLATCLFRLNISHEFLSLTTLMQFLDSANNRQNDKPQSHTDCKNA